MPSKVERWLASQAKKQEGTATDKIRADRALDSGSEEFRVGAELDRYVGKASALAPYSPAPTTEQTTYVEQTPLERKEQTLVSAARQRAEKRKTAGDDFYKKEYGMTKAEYDKEYDAIDRMSAVREARSDMQEIEDTAKALAEVEQTLQGLQTQLNDADAMTENFKAYKQRYDTIKGLVSEYRDYLADGIRTIPTESFSNVDITALKDEDGFVDFINKLPDEQVEALFGKAAFVKEVDNAIKELEQSINPEGAFDRDNADYKYDFFGEMRGTDIDRVKERNAKLEQLRDLQKSVYENDFVSGWHETADIRDIGSFGLSSLASQMEIESSLRKAEQGQPLTFDDQYNIKISELKQGLEEIRKWRGGASFWNSLGSGAAHSSQFVIETLMTGGLGSAAKVITSGIKQAFKQRVGRGLAHLAFKNVPKTLVYGAKRSPLMAGTYRNLMDRRINQYSVANGQVDLTNPESLWKSIGVAWADQSFEIASELWGNMLHLGFGKIGKAIGADKWLKTKSVSLKTTPAMRRVLRDGLLWSGDMPSEITSEFLGDVATNLAYSAFNKDEQYWGELFTRDYWGNLLALTAGLKAGVTVASIPSIVASNKKVKQLEARSAEAFNAIGNEELKNKVLNLGGRTDIEDVAEYMHSIDWSQYKPIEVAHAIDYMMSEVERQVVAGSESEQERAERYAPRLERIQELAYRNAEGVAMPTMVTAEANFGADDTKSVTIIQGDYNNPEAMVWVRLSDGTTKAVVGEKISNVQETDMASLVAEDYAMTFAEEDAMETLGEVEQTLFDMQRTGASNTQQIRAVEKAGLTVFNEGEVVTLLNGEEATVVEGFRHGLYTVMRADGSLSMVGVGGILQPDVAIAQAQRSAAMPQEQTPLTQSAPLPEGIDTTTDYATPDGFVGKAVDYDAESDQVTLQSADGGLTNVPRASLTTANAEQIAPQEDITENLATETISEMEQGEAEAIPMPVAPQTAPIPQNADGSVDYESMTDATMYANALESDMGNVADAQEAVADVRQSKEAELAKLQEQKKQTANMNEKVALRQQEQKLVQQIAMLNEVESILGNRATAVEAETAPTTEPMRAIAEGVKDNYLATQLRNENPAEYNTFNALAKLLGLEIEFVESAGEGNALIVGNKMQVAYNPANREETLRFLIGHESLHRMKQVAPEAYAELMEDVKSYIGEELFGQRVERLRVRYEHQGIAITEESLEEEVVADFIGEMEEDYNVVSDLVTNNPNKSWWQKLIEGLRKLFRFLEGAEADTTKVASILNKIETAYQTAAEKVQTLEVEKPVTTTTEAAEVRGAKLSIKTEAHLESNLRKFATSKDGKRAGWTPQKVDSIIEETKALINAIDAALRGNSFYDAFADREPTIRTDWRDGVMKPTVTWTRANIEYKYDMSADLLCINNDGIENVLASAEMVGLMKMLPTKATKEGGKVYDLAITADDYLTLYDIMDKMGYVVPCKGCFDAAGRFKMLPSVAQKFVADVNATIDERNANPEKFDEGVRKMAGKKDAKTIEGLPAKAETKKDAIRIGVAGDKATQHLDWTDFMSAEGQAKMLETYGGIFRAWQRTGAGRPKDKLPAEPYYGDIMSNTTTIIGKFGEKTPSFREVEVNQGTGLRRNSHSEFRPILAVDEIQFMRDAFIRGLFVFKYMKELDDVRLFGNMGVKFNISFFPAFVEGGKAAGLDANGNYIASEESAGAREFAYEGEDGNIHYDGMKGWEEAKKYTNEDVSLSSVVFSIPHLIKALTDVPTPTNKEGEWGSLIPFHPSGATEKQLTAQGLGKPRAMGTSFDEAMSDYDKGVTNFEHVQNDRFGEGWVVVAGQKAGTKVKAGHKIEFANGNHYFNAERGLHLFSSGYIVDSELTDEQRDTLINGEEKARKAVKKEMIHPFVVDYNDKVREIGTPHAYKEAADYYIKALRDLGLIPRFEFEVKEDVFLKMCADANVDPRHPKLGWKGEGHSWSPTDAESYYSLFCDYGMTNPETGEWSPHRAVGYINENGEREFRLPDNAVEIVKEGLDTYTARRNKETAMDREAIRAFADKMVEQGRLTENQVNEVLGEDIKYSLIGEKGASALDAFEESTTRLDNLNVAREMEASGKDAKTIKMATGWERGVDGLWRYEIMDARLKAPDGFIHLRNPKLSDIVENADELFAAYPALKDVKIKLSKARDYAGVYYPSENVIKISTGLLRHYNNKANEYSIFPRDVEMNIRNLLQAMAATTLTLVHEIQHAIQHIEGFAEGGNSRMVLNDSKADLQALWEEWSNRAKAYNAKSTDWRLSPEGRAEREALMKEKRRLNSLQRKNSLGASGYHKLAGEVEARNVSKRFVMSMEERLASLAEETEDVAREDQIILREGVVSGAKLSLRNPEWQSQFGVPLADGKELSLEDVRTIFEKTNKRKVLQQMFDKVYEVMEKLPYYGIIVTSQMPEGSEDSLGVADGKGNILLNVRMFQEISNKGIATTILHEMIHSATIYATIAYEERNENPEAYKALPENIKTACQRLQNIYDFLLKRNNLKEEYGMTSIHEMLAELSNPQFRALLREEGVWEKLVNALKRFFGIGTGKTVKELDETLKTFLENFDRSAYVETVEAIAGEKVFERKVDAKETDNQGKEVKYSLKALDAPYLDAVARRDMATAERLVREAAAIAMPDTMVLDEDGLPKVVYHQTNATVYINRETGQNWDELDWRERMEWDERDDWDEYWEEQDFNTFSRVNARTTNEFDGFFFAPEYDEYHEYGDRTIRAFLDIRKPASREDYNIDASKNDAGRDERIRLQSEGYDGVIREEDGTIWEYIAFEPNQIKSADVVTYDDAGNIIPLSERFNPKKEDIRYSLREATGEKLTPAMIRHHMMENVTRHHEQEVNRINRFYDREERQAKALAKKARKEAGLVYPKNGKITDRLAFLIPDGKTTLPMELQVTYDIANGLKLKWSDSKDGRKHGLSSELGLGSSRKEGYGAITVGATMYVEDYVAQLMEENSGYSRDLDDNDIRNAVINVLSQYTKPKQAIQALEDIFLSNEMDDAEAEALYKIDLRRQEALEAEEKRYAELKASYERNPRAFERDYFEQMEKDVVALNFKEREIRRLKRDIKALRNTHNKTYREQAERIQKVREAIDDFLKSTFGRNISTTEVKRLFDALQKATTQKQLERVIEAVSRMEKRTTDRIEQERKRRLLKMKLSFFIPADAMSLEEYLKDENQKASDAAAIIDYYNTENSDPVMNTFRIALKDRYKGKDSSGVSVAKLIDAETAEIMAFISTNATRRDIVEANLAEETAKLYEAKEKLKGKLPFSQSTMDKIDQAYEVVLNYWEADIKRQGAISYNKAMRELSIEIEMAKKKRDEAQLAGSDELYELAVAEVAGLMNEARELAESHYDGMGKANKILMEANDAVERLLLGGRRLLSEEREAKRKHDAEVLRDAINDITNYGEEYKELNAKAHDQRKASKDKEPSRLKRIHSEWADSLEYLLNVMAPYAPEGSGLTYQRIIGGALGAASTLYSNTQVVNMAVVGAIKRIWGGKMKHNTLPKLLNQSQQIVLAENYAIGYYEEEEDGKKVKKPRRWCLTMGNAIYLLAMWEQPDSHYKLTANGVTQEVIDDVTSLIANKDARWIEFKNWVVDELLPARREVYDETHRKVQGTYMAESKNYFPIHILSQDRHQEEKASEDKAQQRSIKPSGIKQRVYNTNMIDLNVDFVKALMDNLYTMEMWAAIAPVEEDMNVILSNNTAKNLMNAKFGADFSQRLKTAMQVTVGTLTSGYINSTEKFFQDLTRRWGGTKIAFGINTALKQLAGAGAMCVYTADLRFLWYLAKNIQFLFTPKSAQEFFPMLQKRWEEGLAGNIGLKELFRSDVTTSSGFDIAMENVNRVTTDIVKLGMIPNKIVDIAVCAMMVKSVYEYEYNRYIKQGYSKEMAEKKAMIDAESSYNKTQQSSEMAFLSSGQVSSNILYRSLNIFMNNSIANYRIGVMGIEDIKKGLFRFKKAQRNMRKATERRLFEQYTASGMAEEEARAKAQQEADIITSKLSRSSFVAKGIFRSLWGFYFANIVFGFMGIAPYLLFGDDDDKKEELIIDLLKSSIWTPLTLIPTTKAIYETLAYAWKRYEEGRGYQVSIAESLFPMLEDVDQAITNSVGMVADIADGGDMSYAQIYNTFDALLRMGVGVDTNRMLTITDGFIDLGNGDWLEGTLDVLSVPKSQIKLLTGDRKDGETAKEYMTRVMRTMSIVDKNKIDVAELENYNFETGKWEKPTNISAAEKRKVSEIYNQYQAEYKKEMLTKCSEEVRTNYPEVVEKHAEILKDMGVRDTTLALVRYYEQMVDTLTPEAASALESLANLQAKISETERILDRLVSQGDKEYINLLTEEFNLRKEFVAQYEIYENLTK